MLTEQTRDRILRLKSRYPNKKSAVIPSLYLVQAEQGYCTEEGIGEIAELLEMVPADVFSTASFYTMIYKEPVGKKVIDVCTNLACMVNGSDEILEYLSDRLHTPVEGTSPDGRCSLRRAECLGYCDRAPMLQIDYRPFGPLDRETVDRLIVEEKLVPGTGDEENGVAASSLELSGTVIHGHDVGR